MSPYYKSGGRLNAFILPTAEGQVPPLLEQEPVGGRGLWGQHVSLMIGDRGAALPANYHEHPELWILEYLNGHFYDVTEFYKTTKREPARHLFEDAAAFRARVSRDEYYPDYNRFDVPTGRPFFFPTPQRDILTQIGEGVDDLVFRIRIRIRPVGARIERRVFHDGARRHRCVPAEADVVAQRFVRHERLRQLTSPPASLADA